MTIFKWIMNLHDLLMTNDLTTLLVILDYKVLIIDFTLQILNLEAPSEVTSKLTWKLAVSVCTCKQGAFLIVSALLSP